MWIPSYLKENPKHYDHYKKTQKQTLKKWPELKILQEKQPVEKLQRKLSLKKLLEKLLQQEVESKKHVDGDLEPLL